MVGKPEGIRFPSEVRVERVVNFLERETASARCFVAERRCGLQRLLLCHHDVACVGCQGEPRMAHTISEAMFGNQAQSDRANRGAVPSCPSVVSEA
jgi:hypothetical protein